MRRTDRRLDGAGSAAYTAVNRRPRRSANLAGRRVFFHGPLRAAIATAFIIVLLSACQPSPNLSTGVEEAPTSAPTALATVPSPPTSVGPAASPTASPTERSCRQAGSIEHDSVPQDGFGREIPFAIYLPPCYGQLDHGLPTLYLLHGLSGDDSQWPRLGVAAAADHLILDEGGTPFLIVMPWQRTGLDSEPAILNGLLPYVEANYHALPGPTWRAIGGLSRGAGWAFRIGFHHLDQFSAVGLHSPALLNGDLVSVGRWLAQSGLGDAPRLWIDIGDRDTLLASAEELRARLDELHVPYEFHLGQGWHDEAYWAAQLDAYLAWYAAGW